jgi:hypothetical protein
MRLTGELHMTQQTNRRRGDSANRWRGLVLAAAVLGMAVLAVAQPPAALQEKLAAVKQSIAANQQKLHQYKWVETTQLTLNGDAKPASQSMCMYGPDGTVQKTPMSAPPPPPSGRRLKQKIIADKTADMKDYMGQVKTLLALYVPPDPQKMQAAFAAQKAMLGDGTLIFTDYALPGDKMTVSFDPAVKKVTGLNVNTYMDDPKDVVTLAVQFSSLPDGTNYAVQTVLNATAKKLVVTTSNSNYTPVGQ